MFGEKILDYWDDILRDLKEIIAVPSVAVPQAGPYPFGKDAAAAVDKAMELCARRSRALASPTCSIPTSRRFTCRRTARSCSSSRAPTKT